MKDLILPLNFAQLSVDQLQRVAELESDEEFEKAAISALSKYLTVLESRAPMDDFEIFSLACELRGVWPHQSKVSLLKHLEASIGSEAYSIFARAFGESQQANKKAAQPGKADIEILEQRLPRLNAAQRSSAVEDLLDKNRKYVEQTADTDILQIQLNRICISLSKISEKSEAENVGILIQNTCRLALTWIPWDGFFWAQWAKSYSLQGAFEAAEVVLWEANRRFPGNEHILSYLCGMIFRRKGRKTEAIEILASNKHWFGDNRVLLNQKASFHFHRGLDDDNLACLRELSANFRMNDASIYDYGLAAGAVVRASANAENLNEYMTEALRTFDFNESAVVFIGESLLRSAKRHSIALAYAESLTKKKGHKSLRIRCLIARLLWSSTDKEVKNQGETQLKTLIKRFPDEPLPVFLLVTLLHNSGKTDQAIGLLYEFSELRTDLLEDIQDLLHKLKSKQKVPIERLSDVGIDPSSQPPKIVNSVASKEPVAGPGAAVSLSGKMRRISAQLDLSDDGIQKSALKELNQILSVDPDFAYARILAARQKIWDENSLSESGFGAAFEIALSERDIEMLRSMEREYPRFELLVLLAQIALGHSVAKHRLAALRRPARFAVGGIPNKIGITLKNVLPKDTTLDGKAVPVKQRDDLILKLQSLNESVAVATPLAF